MDASKTLPGATSNRTPDKLYYPHAPAIFHEVFGHGPLLTNPCSAEFTHTYGQLGLKASKEERVFLARLYWMTVEFGLVETPAGLRIYGGGILSSPKETLYSLYAEPERQPFDAREAMRTPYRIDILQPPYFGLPDPQPLFHPTQPNG